MKLIAQHGNDQIVFDLGNGEYKVGRSERCELRLKPSWSIASNIHLSLRIGGGDQIEIIDGFSDKPSTNGTQVNNHYIPSDKWTILKTDDEITIGNDSRECIRLRVHDSKAGDNSQSELENTTNDLSIGRSQDCSVRIDGPTVSRIHAVIRQRGGAVRLIDNSQNGVYINGHRAARTNELHDGDEIKIGTYIFLWSKGKLLRKTSGKNYRIDVNNLSLPGRINGTSLSIEPGQLVAFVGGSGAGKSSLLTTLVGHNMDYSGSILINGSELRESYNSIKQEIGFVPQDDIVHMDLTVEEVLRYSARLKLPDPETQREAVEKTLTELEIVHRRSAKIRDLSGGQRKRVSIGVEMLADPRILFLDEPTSGLDPGLDKRMMQLLRSLADSGRTVALVTHATNNVMLCDQVVFLGRGGYLCYAGEPEKCNEYFSVEGDFSDVYQRLEVTNDEIRDLSLKFKETQRKDIRNKLASEKASSEQWSDTVLSRANDFLPQLQTLMSRDLKLQSRDATSIVLNAVTAPAAAFMLAVAANKRDIFNSSGGQDINTFLDAQRILFIVVCATIWVGLSSSLQTIVKERPIFKRERAFNLLPEAYLTAKFVVMVGTSAIQALLLAITISLLFDYPDVIGSHWVVRIGIAAFITLVAIGSQALLVSSLVKNSQQASSIAPLLLIPQLVFGGVLFHLSESAEGIYSVISSRWSMILMGSWSDITSLIPRPPSGTIDLSKIQGASSYENTISNIHEAISMMSGQTLILTTLTLICLLFYKRNRQ